VVSVLKSVNFYESPSVCYAFPTFAVIFLTRS